MKEKCSSSIFFDSHLRIALNNCVRWQRFIFFYRQHLLSITIRTYKSNGELSLRYIFISLHIHFELFISILWKQKLLFICAHCLHLLSIYTHKYFLESQKYICYLLYDVIHDFLMLEISSIIIRNIAFTGIKRNA